ncbi:MerC domain-containing protein [Teredinibacter turnerae]|uniref:MerC domain-containing protein n=1 Tax=Teredinibacter turnerae TaxID=2426 RepID=UPI000368E952|nr:MerC domain-containing protein [Teredinibacter turnerae]
MFWVLKNMIALQQISDKLAISLSALCAIHCLVLSLVALFLSSIAALPFAQESFHLWIVVVVIPVSACALNMGCKKHKRKCVLVLGISGLAMLIAAALLGETLGVIIEKLLTLFAVSMVVAGHLWNFRLCRQPSACHCPRH